MTEEESNVTDVRRMASTPEGKRAVYVCCLRQYASENFVAFMCIEQFSRERKKRQALMICQWFIDEDFPEEVSSLMTAINMSGDEKKEAAREYSKIKKKIDAIGKTMKDKVKKHGGGIGGFIGALKQKATTSTKIDGKFFDTMQDQAAWNIRAAVVQEGGLDESAAPDARWINHIIALKRELKIAGFDPDAMGIYA